MKEPLLTIVIANYNYGRFIGDALESVFSQCDEPIEKRPDGGATLIISGTDECLELVVCDAKSTDNSLAIIQANSSRLAWWCSEKDGGQSEAFNKGFSHGNGLFLTWLNSDDVLMPGSLRNLVRFVRAYPSVEWFVGGAIWMDVNQHVIRFCRARNFSVKRALCGEISVWGPSSFFSRRLYERVGRIDNRFQYTMDTDLWRRFFAVGIRYQPITGYVWGLRLHPDAKMSGHNFQGGASEFRSGTALLVPKDSRKGIQLKREQIWMNAKTPPTRKYTRLTRWISMSYCKAIGSLMDTFFFKGRHYKEYYQ